MIRMIGDMGSTRWLQCFHGWGDDDNCCLWVNSNRHRVILIGNGRLAFYGGGNAHGVLIDLVVKMSGVTNNQEK